MELTAAWTRLAKHDLKKLPKRDAERVRHAVLQLGLTGQGDIERLRGFNPPEYRLRVGPWRVRYRLKQDGMSIVRVLHRREAYRKSALIRQDTPGVDGMNETGDCGIPETISD